MSTATVKCSLWCSTIMRKQVVALTGLALSGFLLMHMSGNLLILAGPEMYNTYSYKLITNPLLIPAEIALVLMFVVHVYLAASLTRQNWVARPQTSGAIRGGGEKLARFGSKSMILTGAVVFVFTVLHLITFKYGTHYEATYNGVVMRDLHRLIIEKFREPLYVAWYLIALVILGVHLSHGFSATFQSLGIGSVKWKGLRRLGWAFAFVISVGFIIQPIYVVLTGGN